MKTEDEIKQEKLKEEDDEFLAMIDDKVLEAALESQLDVKKEESETETEHETEEETP